MNGMRLCDVADIQLGKMLSPKAKNGAGVSCRYLRNQNVQWGRFDLADLATMRFTPDERSKFELRDGDLLVCEGGEPGRCAVWRRNLTDCYFQKALHRVRSHAATMDPDFLAFWIRHLAFANAFADQNAKTTIAHLPLVRLRDLPVPAMELSGQRRIVACLKARLAAVETARKAAHAQVADAEALRQAIYREAFAEAVPVAVPPHFETPPAGWCWTKLADLARLESGHTPSRLHPEWWGGDVSWISLTEIRGLDGTWADSTRLRTNAAGIAHSAARILPRGTVCYSRTASVGFVTIMGKPMATSQDFANWVCGDGLDPEFLMHALIRSRAELRELASGATHKTIYMPTLSSFHLCAPARPEQERIVAELKQRLAAADRMAGAVRAQLTDLGALPARLLAQVFDPVRPELVEG